MRIRVRQTRRGLSQVALNLTSMIDIIFLLLIYFMVTMVVSQPEDRLSPTLQTKRNAASGDSTDFQPQVIEVVIVDGAPGYRLGSQVYRDKTSLADRLAELPKEAGVFITVSGNVSVGFATAAVQAARDADFEKVTYVPADE